MRTRNYPANRKKRKSTARVITNYEQIVLNRLREGPLPYYDRRKLAVSNPLELIQVLRRKGFKIETVRKEGDRGFATHYLWENTNALL